MVTFLERLDNACNSSKSLVCVGLDPDPALMPTSVKDVFSFNKAIVDATHDLACAYKPNLAFYEALGLPGLKALEQTIQHIRDVAPDIVLLGDAKRGDIGNTATAYAKAMFDVWGFDAATVNPYGGHDAVQPFLDYRDKGALIWCRSSNPGAGDIQDLATPVGGNQVTLYQVIAQRATDWNRYGNVGLVMGATYPRQLAEVRSICPTMPILIPGLGAQAGDLEMSVKNGVDKNGLRALFNSSRGIIYASRGNDFADAARNAATELRNAINAARASQGHSW